MSPTYLEAIPLNYRKYGDTGPDLIVLHGLFASGKNWRSFARSIENDFQIWMPDARNHGESPHAETMSYKEMAEDVVCFLDNNGLERIMLLGHSMGGKTAMQVALRFPERVSCLIVVYIAPVQYEHLHKNLKLIRAKQELGLPKIMTRAEVEKKLAYKIDEKHILSFLMTNLICKEGQSQWRIGLEQIASGLQVLLNHLNPENTFSGPTLFLGGANSDYIKTEYHKQIRILFPESSVKMLKNCGHWLHVEQPESFQKTVSAFLQQNGLL